MSVEYTDPVMVAGVDAIPETVTTPDAAVENAPPAPPEANPLPPADPYVFVYAVEKIVE